MLFAVVIVMIIALLAVAYKEKFFIPPYSKPRRIVNRDS